MDAGAVHRAKVLFVGAGPYRAVFGEKRIDIDVPELQREVGECSTQVGRFQPGDEQVTGTNLRLAKEKRGIMPSAVEDIDHAVGDAGYVGFVLAESGNDARQVRQQPRVIELVVIA